MGEAFTEVVVHCRMKRFIIGFYFCRVTERSQASRILKYIVSETIQRVKESLNRRLSEAAVTGHDGVQVVSVMTGL